MRLFLEGVAAAIFLTIMAIVGISHPEEPLIFFGTAVLAAIPVTYVLYKLISSN